MSRTCLGFVSVVRTLVTCSTRQKLPLPGQEEGAEKEEQKNGPLKSRRLAPAL